MTPRDALSFNAALVLKALRLGHGYGFDVMRITDLPSGTVYPILRRLEGSGLVTSSWEKAADAHGDDRPARRYYRVTPDGLAALEAALERIAAQGRLLGARPRGAE